MIKVPHGLKEEFPEHAGVLDELRRGDATFARLCEKYEQANAEVSLMESGVQPLADHVERDMRKRRMMFKDEIADYLRNLGR